MIFVWASSLYFENSRPPEASTEIFVVGKQWMWHIQHPEGVREINELHVPVNAPIKITMTSDDVIHDFYIPAFRVKKDAVPGRYTSLWFQATKIGTFHIFCAQYCGADHAEMIGWVYVMSPADYAAWLSGGARNESMAQTGERLFTQLGCVTCHVADNTGRGPSLVGLYGKQEKLRNGDMKLVDETLIRQADRESQFHHPAQLSADHAHLPGPDQRGAGVAADRLRQVARDGRKEDEREMSTTVIPEMPGQEIPAESRVNYLNASYGVKSWLLTTDHKRIALLYLGSITFMFFVGGLFAVLMRLHLIDPQGALVAPETYNKLFTMHGVIMVFFFLVPSIPATLGNFLVPMMIGARDLAFPRSIC